ncbi:MAG: VTT domain-containing protein [Chloroflexi bacterium]|nr:VTT domain-containing protein [Chloroflexota bacterium]
MDGLNAFLDMYGLTAIFVIMLTKSAGVPLPIPADALMLATSARAAEGKLVLPQAFVALLVALVAGGVIQFLLVRGPGRSILFRYGRYLGLTPERLETASRRLKSGGTIGIGLAILTPGVRSVAVTACGLAGIPLRQFAAGLALGSALFLSLHFFLGYAIGAALTAISQVIPMPLLVGALVALVIAGLGVWYVIRRRQLPHATHAEIVAEAIGAWHEATCPVCLALGAADHLQIHHVHAEGH